MPGWEQLGMQAASQVTGGALGLILGNINDRRQLRQQEKLQQLQIRGSKELTDYNAIKQMEMWRNTSYPAQMEMLKKAGLNPALIYGSSGPGGMTNLATGNVASGNAPTGGGEIQSMMGMGLMSAMQAAQIENIKANTEKTKAETPNVIETGKGITLDNARKQIDNTIAAIEEHVAGQTQNQRIAMYAQETEASMKKLEMLRNEAGINKERLDAEVKNLWGELANKAIDIELKEANINLTNAEIRKIDKQIWEIAETVAQKWEMVGIEDFKNVMQDVHQAWERSGLPLKAKEILNSVTTTIMGGIILKGMGKGAGTTIRGFQIPKK